MDNRGSTVPKKTTPRTRANKLQTNISLFNNCVSNYGETDNEVILFLGFIYWLEWRALSRGDLIILWCDV